MRTCMLAVPSGGKTSSVAILQRSSYKGFTRIPLFLLILPCINAFSPSGAWHNQYRCNGQLKAEDFEVREHKGRFRWPVMDSPAACATKPQGLSEFVKEVSSSIGDGSFSSLALTHNALENLETDAPGPDDSPIKEFSRLKRVQGRIVEMKKGNRLQLTLKYQRRDITQNLKFEEVASTLEQVMDYKLFRQGRLNTATHDISIKLQDGGKAKLKNMKPTQKEPPPRTHDKPKPKLVATGAPFLQALGITKADGSPRERMSAKRRQIEKYVETLSTLVPPSMQPLRIVDVGCGRGYLTFATHAHFARVGHEVKTLGVEVRRDLVTETNAISRRLAEEDRTFETLQFVESTIEDYLHSSVEGGIEVDLLIALHACDTATDDALWCGIKNGAHVIVTAPCCHKELRPQLDDIVKQPIMSTGDVDSEGEIGGSEAGHALWASFRHGIYRERGAEMATDSMRALLLEIAGYDVKVFEFIGGEHTAKNVMITATKRKIPRTALQLARLREQLVALSRLFGTQQQHLASLMGETLTS